MLSEAQQGKVLEAIENDDERRAHAATDLLMATGALGAPRVLPVLLKKYRTASVRESVALMALGFVPKPSVTPEQREEILKAIRGPELKTDGAPGPVIGRPSAGPRAGRGLDPYSLAGLASVYLRTADDTQRALGEVEEALRGKLAMSQWLYWEGLRGKVCDIPLDPAKWKARWSTKVPRAEGGLSLAGLSDAIRQGVIASILAHPDAAEVPWVIEQAIKEDGATRSLLDVLTEIGGRAAGLKKVPGLRDWLLKLATEDRDPFRQFTAAGVLSVVFEENEKALAVVKQGLSSRRELGLMWSSGTEILLRLAPDGEALKRFREMQLAPVEENRRMPGGQFVVWLLDLRLGRQVGEVPLESYLESLQRPDAKLFLAGLSRAGARASPEVRASLRTPQVILSAGDPKLASVLLGALDALELGLSSGK